MNYFRKPSKYRNIKVECDGHIFDSKDEKYRYIQLKMLEKAGKILNLEIQPKFLLFDGFKYNGKKYRDMYYIADFSYIEDGKFIVEDVKSSITREKDVYAIKKKMFIYRHMLNGNVDEFREHLKKQYGAAALNPKNKNEYIKKEKEKKVCTKKKSTSNMEKMSEKNSHKEFKN